MRGFLAATLALFATASYAAATPAKDVPPFSYSFQVTSVKISGTASSSGITATTSFRLSALPRRKTLTWLGKDKHIPHGYTAALLRFRGVVTYTGSDPTCRRMFTIDSARWRPINAGLVVVNARDRIVTNPGIYVSVGRFPLAEAYPEGCQAGRPRWWPWQEASQVVPLSVLERATFSMTVKRKQRLGQTTVDWTVQMTVRRIRYRQLNCSKSAITC